MTAPPRVLALDTSGGELLVALVDPEVGMLVGLAEPGARHQERVIEAIVEVVGASGLASIDAVAVVRGPGSHTGLRVGLATGEGIAFARHLRIYPLSSLTVAAHRARLGSGAVTAVVSAGRGRVHAQRFDVEGGRRDPIAEPLLASVGSLTGAGLLSGEASLMTQAAAAGASVAPQVPGGEALAAAANQAVGDGAGVAYHEIRGEYGELSMEQTP
ncbi:MAG: tRNA (adenosine(37)-N6)-threonylcarbamoyltransferase complex dimerization subunit type 1 TsaB [Candidatus Dormibacteraeota bacterium]|nr:tRNA (adenosine(37)-N6)-threonylcarbamoyltransferase complex dimerization subunit type 1 TsaB [Candidatus Dormibacteraeota bacterium]